MNCNDIGLKISKNEFVSFLNSVKGGQYFIVKGYQNSSNEVADHILRFGIRYGQIKDRDISLLRNILAGKQMPNLTVSHGVWIPPDKLVGDNLFSSVGENLVAITIKYDHLLPDGTSIRVEKTGHTDLLDTLVYGNRRGNKKDGYNVQTTISYSLPCNHPLVLNAIGEADGQDEGTVLQGLLKPREATTEYNQEATSAYSMEKDGKTQWYIRDVLAVHKNVRVEGNYPFSASLPINATKKAVQSQWLLTSKYRQFILTDGQFESITISGQAVLCDGVDEQFYLALPEIVRETVNAEAVI